MGGFQMKYVGQLQHCTATENRPRRFISGPIATWKKETKFSIANQKKRNIKKNFNKTRKKRLVEVLHFNYVTTAGTLCWQKTLLIFKKQLFSTAVSDPPDSRGDLIT